MMDFPKVNTLDNWLNKNGSPAIDAFIEKNLAISNKVIAELKNQNINIEQFAKKLDKKPKKIAKWLSGQHNLSLTAITKMEAALGVDLINIEP